jgi:4-hydroxybenzoate polyprenyltransferase
MAYLELLRPAQWSKNVFVLVGLVFAQRLAEPGSVVAALLAFVCFCALSSSVYVFNDIHDRNEDRLHPTKRQRPLASGRVSVGSAALVGLALLLGGLGGGFLLNRAFFLVALIYIVLQAGYTTVLKHVTIADVIFIGLGFVLRAVAGVVVLEGAAISPWLVICTFTLCLFMGFSKRRCELNALAEDPANGVDEAARHRRTLAHYTPELLNHMTTLSAGIAVVSFVLYAMDARTREVFGTNYLVYTLPLVVYAVFRFALLVEHGRVNGPTDVLLRDRPFQIALLLWGLAAYVIVYHGRTLQGWLSEFVNHSSA